MQLQLHAQATLREYRELREFARFCIDNIERDLGRAASWRVAIAPNGVCYSCTVIVEHLGVAMRGHGDGFDGAVAGREAFCKIEKLLRENSALLELSKQEATRAAR